MEDKNIKKRADVDEMNQWKLSVIYENSEKWRTAFTDWQNFSKKLNSYEGRLSDVSILIEFWKYYEQVMREGERLYAFAFLKLSLPINWSREYFSNFSVKLFKFISDN